MEIKSWSALTALIAKQEEIISLMSQIIDELFRLLMQHITVEEAEGLPELSMIRRVAQLQKELEGGGPHEHY